MNTGEVLDLFKISAEGEPAKAKSAGVGAVSVSKMLEEYVHTSNCYKEVSSTNHVRYCFSLGWMSFHQKMSTQNCRCPISSVKYKV